MIFSEQVECKINLLEAALWQFVDSETKSETLYSLKFSIDRIFNRTAYQEGFHSFHSLIFSTFDISQLKYKCDRQNSSNPVDSDSEHLSSSILGRYHVTVFFTMESAYRNYSYIAIATSESKNEEEMLTKFNSGWRKCVLDSQTTRWHEFLHTKLAAESTKTAQNTFTANVTLD